MTRNIKGIIKTSLFLFSGSLMLWNCESEADNLGSQFFDNNAATGTTKYYDVVAYNINNNDTIRTDAAKLTSATLGAFTEPQFGMQKSSYVTQVRMGSYAPDFGTNAVVDSVVLVMKPEYATDSVKTVTDENYIFPDNIAAKKVVNTYPIKNKYGKTKSSLTININEVNDFLGGAEDKVSSDKYVNVGALIGTKSFNGYVSSVKVTKDADNSELLSRDAGIRIPLDKTFFQNKIIAKSDAAELSDVANFIRYFKGIRISVAENDGYIFNFNPNNLEMVMYYKKDVTSNGTTTSTPTSFTFSLGSGNVHFNQIEYNRSSAFTSALSAINPLTGDAKIYAQGMGGPSFALKIPASTVAAVKNIYQTQGVGILSAKIRLYTDASVWNNTYTKPSYFTVREQNLNTFLSDLTTFNASAVYSLVKGYDLAKNPSYYDISITDTFKNYVEKQTEAKDIVLILNVGNYETSATNNALLGQNYNTRAYTPNRVILIGNEKLVSSTEVPQAQTPQLNIIYAKK